LFHYLEIDALVLSNEFVFAVIFAAISVA